MFKLEQQRWGQADAVRSLGHLRTEQESHMFTPKKEINQLISRGAREHGDLVFWPQHSRQGAVPCSGASGSIPGLGRPAAPSSPLSVPPTSNDNEHVPRNDQLSLVENR